MSTKINKLEADFWTRLDAARTKIAQNDTTAAQEVISGLLRTTTLQGHDTYRTMRRQVLDSFIRTYDLSIPEDDPSLATQGLLVATARPLDGVSLVTCCMNRTENLLLALPSWLAARDINEIIIVDWNSSVPVQTALDNANISNSRIRVVRVDNEPRWILSYAFNIGFRLASRERIIKVDSDIVLHRDFVARNPLPEGAFIAGNWRTVAEDQAHINGFFYIRAKDILGVNGFNEFITTYGWDDDDLYGRLKKAGLTRTDVAQKSIYHVEHDDAQRITSDASTIDNWQAFVSSPELKIESNRLAAEMMPDWSPQYDMMPYRWRTNATGQSGLARSGAVPYPVDDGLREQANLLAAYKLTSWKVGPMAFSVSPETLKAMILEHGFDAIKRRKFQKQAEGAKLASPAVSTGRPKFYIDAQHGLGNRLRAMGSAASIAKNTDRELVIVWEPDHHCECRLSDLFDYDGPVIETSFLDDARAQNANIFNYMEIEEGAQKDAPLPPDMNGDVYARSAYPLKSEHTTWGEENRFIQSLHPNQAVQDLIATVPGGYDLSVHIRMVGGDSAQHLSYEKVENWTQEGHDQIEHWRSKSHYSNFMKRIDALIESKSCNRFFLAADNAEAYDAFKTTYGDKICCLERELYDRSAQQLQYALADAILLSQPPLILGSNWSSFTELAMRLAPHKIKLELSGKDF